MEPERCPYYEDVPVKSCGAVLEGIKVPTEGEVKRFCKGGHYRRCPTFINRIKKEKEVLEGK
ncbi:MAG: hypothetical protein HZA13_05480 [Nitrospirae bacterium]|nr:hypothetical protein [Nitrospirota bacterium]